MAKYTYRCRYTPDENSLLQDQIEHLVERDYPIGKCAPAPMCEVHGTEMERAFDVDMGTLTIDHIGDDPFRRYYLSGQGERAAREQDRLITGPRDRSEARAIEAATGRKYIGNNTESLTPKEQKALENRGYGKVT